MIEIDSHNGLLTQKSSQYRTIYIQYLGLSYYHPTGCHPPVGGMVRIRLTCWLVLFSPCKVVTREVGDYKTQGAGVLFSPGQKMLHQVGW